MNRTLLSAEIRIRRFTGLTKTRLDGITLDISPKYTPKFVTRFILTDSYEEPERTIVKKVVRPGMSVVEIGAGIGAVGLLAARLAKGGKVVSYEANPDLEKAIRHNYSLNAETPILHMCAVSLDGSTVTFYRSDNIIASSLIERDVAAKPITVRSTRFQDVISENKPDVLIIDVEGAEVSLLGESDLGGIQHIIAELHPHVVGNAAIDSLTKTIEAKGFSVAEQIKKTVHFKRNIYS